MSPKGGAREGAGRKSKYGDEGPGVRVSVRIPGALYALLMERVLATGRSASDIIVEAVRAYLSTPAPPPEPPPPSE